MANSATTDLKHIRNFLQLSAEVGTAGQPEAAQFAAIKAAGYQLVINLALPDSPNALLDEQAVAQGAGLEYAHIPIAFDAPQVADAQRFFEIMQAHDGQKIFVHCAANMRVSAFMYLYRTLVEKVDEPTAKADLRQLWEPNATWQAFIAAVETDFNSPQRHKSFHKEHKEVKRRG